MFQPPRGTRDFLPEEMLKRNWVLDRIRKVYEIYGFEPLGTPAFESWDMLKIKSGEDVVNQIYYFKDKSERELGLRFEWTASLARVVAAHRELPMPFKRYAMGPVWRYERPSESRYREFWQADADIVGVADPIADAESLAVAVDCLRRLGFEGFMVRLNDRRILNAFVEYVGMPKERALDIFRAIDKLDKTGRESVIEELSSITPDREASERLLDLIALKGEPGSVIEKTRDTLKGIPVGIEGCNSLRGIIEHSRPFGFHDYVVVDLSLARGLDYYTGPVFEIYAEGYEGYGSISGGGRYDEIIELFGGEPTPATGISFGIDRLVSLLERKGAFDDLHLGAGVYVASVSDSVRPKAIEIVQELRGAGISTVLDLKERKLSRQMDYANRKGFRRVVIVGESELEEGCVAVRDMETGEQRRVKLEELVEALK